MRGLGGTWDRSGEGQARFFTMKGGDNNLQPGALLGLKGDKKQTEGRVWHAGRGHFMQCHPK